MRRFWRTAASTARSGSPFEASAKKAAREYPIRVAKIGRVLNTPEGAESPVAMGVKPQHDLAQNFPSPLLAP